MFKQKLTKRYIDKAKLNGLLQTLFGIGNGSYEIEVGDLILHVGLLDLNNKSRDILEWLMFLKLLGRWRFLNHYHPTRSRPFIRAAPYPRMGLIYQRISSPAPESLQCTDHATVPDRVSEHIKLMSVRQKTR